jgi:hypothetical protein
MPPKRFCPPLVQAKAIRAKARAPRPSKSPAKAYGHYASREVLQVPPQSPLQGVREGGCCPRPHCGGLIALRDVVTVEGSCSELYCVACSRSVVQRVLMPYAPIPSVQDPVLASLLAPDREAGAAGRDSGDSEGIGLPGGIADAVGLHRGWSDESLPLPPLDTH